MMSDDARNSLIAVACVTAIFGATYLFMWLMPDVELPRWTPYAVLALHLLLLLSGAVRWQMERRRRRKREAASS
jgi:hypothetical protein